MISIVDKNIFNIPQTVTIANMKPLEIAIILDDEIYAGEVVMRTASQNTFEVMSISKPKESNCWSKCSMKVRILDPDESITVKIHN